MFRRVEPHFQLPARQVEALRAVDLRLSFGFHGNTAMPLIPGTLNQMVKVYDVVDSDYAGARAFADQLQPGRDVLAHESCDRAGSYSPAMLFEFFSKVTRHTPGVTADDIAQLTTAGHTLPNPDSAQAKDLAAIWDKLASLHATDPIVSAAGSAGIRGVRLWVADATDKELEAFQAEWFIFGPPLQEEERAILRFQKGPELKFRNNRALERLGLAALTMHTTRAERPILGYSGGGLHRKDLEAKLTRHTIPFRSELFSPDWKTRPQTSSIY